MERIIRRSLGLAIVVVVTAGLLSSTTSYAGRIIDPSTTRLGLSINENGDVTSMTSSIYGRSGDKSSLDYRICKSVTDPICDAATEVVIIQYFVMCSQQSDVNCIEDVWAKDSSGKTIKGIYQRHLPASGNADFPASPEMNLPASKGSSFVVRFPSIDHSGGTDEYLVAVKNQSTVFKKAGESATNHKIGVQGLVGAITPFEVLTGGYTPKYVTEGLGSGYDGPASPKGETCFVTDTGICAALRDFPAKYRFGMTLRLSEKLSGWFHGRIATPTIKTTAVGDGSTLSVEANPVRVPSLNFVSPVEEIRQEAKDAIFNGQEWGVSSGPEGVGIFIGFDDELSRNLFTWFTPNFKDKATTTNEYWTFKALGGFRNDQVQKCSIEYGELAGVVTTNSLLYKSGPPVFNKELSTLDYEVASPHYESNGEEAVGTYDLLMRSDVARCIYGFSKAPIKASLEVLASDGSTKVATTSIREEAGWITMSANGFGYSSPTLRATLTQPKEVKTRVTCIKKSMKRTFASDQKRCPKGWKTA